VTAGSVYHLLTLLAGYPSYLALGGTLGIAVLGTKIYKYRGIFIIF